MAWNPYTDWQNRGFAHILTTLFPEQTSTLPRIIVWSLIFLLDLILVAFAVMQTDFISGGSHYKLAACLVALATVAVFWLQGVIWGAIMKFIRELRR